MINKISLSFLLLGLLLKTASAQVPGTLSYQGILVQTDGSAIADGTHSIGFNFYTVPTGGTATLTRTISVTTSKGLYTCIIGDGTAGNLALPASVGTQQLYIGIKVDGGAELLPRAQLTTSPYSFQAQSAYSISDNSVTSAKIVDGTIVSADIATGTIDNTKLASGIDASKITTGTVTVANGGTAASTAAAARTNLGLGSLSTLSIVSGTEIANGTITNADISASAAIDGSKITPNFGALTVSIPSQVAGYFFSNNNYGIYASSNLTDAGYFAGGVTVSNGLYVTGLAVGGTGTLGIAARGYFSATSPGTAIVKDNTTTSGIAIRADGNILAFSGAFIATSDRRIKEIIATTDNKKDLSDLLEIEITDYKFIDKITNGDRLHKKVIAQQLQSIYPVAVNITEGILPDVFDEAKTAEIKGNKTYIQTNKPHQFVSGDEIKLILEKQGEKKYTVNVINENEFTVDEPIHENVFVYGKKVKDLLTVDYDALTTLNISATQQLHKEIEILKAKLLIQEENNKNLAQRLQSIEAFLGKLPDESREITSSIKTDKQ